MPSERAPVCVIPARGGSKRFPRKNLALFRGRTLVGLDGGNGARIIVYSRVIVSTDADEIAEAARAAGGADIRERPADLSGDFTRSSRSSSTRWTGSPRKDTEWTLDR